MKTVTVRTVHSVYFLTVTDGAEIYIQGGRYFPDPTPVHIEAATRDGVRLGLEWIAVGLLMDIQTDGRRVLTSPVLSIDADAAAAPAVH